MYDPNAKLSDRINERVKDLFDDPIFKVGLIILVAVCAVLAVFSPDDKGYQEGSDPYENCSTTRC